MKGPKAPAPRGLSVAVRTAKGRSAASQRWLSRQLNDPYVVAAKQQGWRSRAAFKLIELDERFHLIRPGIAGGGSGGGAWRVDTGGGEARGGVRGGGGPAAGGSDRRGGDAAGGFFRSCGAGAAGGGAGGQGRPGAVGYGAEYHRALRRPIICGSWRWPRRRWSLRWRCWRRAAGSSRRCSRGARSGRCWKRLKRHFASVRHAKPPASRKESSELYVVATGFRGGGGAIG